MSTQVIATPTKRFFVRSLTRDIALKDAILDLLDNCIDGIVRTLDLKSLEGDQIYNGFYAEIKLNPEGFEIHDNCGGIPLDIAIEEAFRFGRSNPERDSELETVGMYGIGMKRAVFKMGSHIMVESQHEGHRYQVEIDPGWLKNDEEWTLQLEDLETLGPDRNGTSIIVHNLHEEIRDRFEPTKEFAKELREEIGQIFALIVRKGFSIKVNDIPVTPVTFDLLHAEDLEDQDVGIRTYQFRSIYDDVEIDIAIGFYRPLASIDEIEENRLNRSLANAGITVVCNDRVVLFRDKTRITGWGSKPVPAFHNQFLPIAGIVRFSSSRSENLPLTTTKRGLDLSAQIYWYTLEYIKEGIKKFTDFTNQWKGKEEDVRKFFKKAEFKDSIKLINSDTSEDWRTVPRGKHQEKRVNPKLPKPPKRNTKIRISYFREKEEIDLVGEYAFGDSNMEPSVIGNFTFEQVLESVRKEL